MPSSFNLFGAVRVAQGSFTRLGSSGAGSQTITGVGFQGTHILMISRNASEAIGSIGLQQKNQSIGSVVNTGSGAWSASSDLIRFQNSAGSIMRATLDSFTSDGFELTWFLSGGLTGTNEMAYFIFKVL